jgi:hypothetical protein
MPWKNLPSFNFKWTTANRAQGNYITSALPLDYWSSSYARQSRIFPLHRMENLFELLSSLCFIWLVAHGCLTSEQILERNEKESKF